MGTLKEFFEGLLKVVTNPRYMVALCVVTAALLFLPQRILAWLSVEPLTIRYRPYIGVAFLFFLVMTMSYPIEHGWKSARRFLQGITFRRRILERLGQLSSDEKGILVSYISNNQRTRYFDYNNGTVANLRLCSILYLPNTTVDIGRVPFTMSERVWDYLHEHPDLLK
jgi:hypothetical protein